MSETVTVKRREYEQLEALVGELHILVRGMRTERDDLITKVADLEAQLSAARAQLGGKGGEC
jgi:hypothetical protein